MRINAKNTNVVVVDGQDIEDMNGFDYGPPTEPT